MLYLYRRVIFGELTKDDLKALVDLDGREILIFAPLVIFTLWMGVYPTTFMDFIHVSVENLTQQHDMAMDVYYATMPAVDSVPIETVTGH